MTGRSKRAVISALVLVAMMLASGTGCGGSRATPENTPRLTVGLIPIEDTLPFWVAERKGYFREEGVEVVLKTFSSAAERDAALTAGQIDGAVADLVAVALLHASGTPVQVTSLTLGAEGREGRIAILAPPGSRLTVDGLRGQEIAVSPHSLIEYTVTRLLERRGFQAGDIKLTSIPKIPVRYELLMNGKTPAAALPDPFAALAEKKGAHLVVDDVEDNISQAVVLFRRQVLSERQDAVGRAMRAYGRAVEDINRDASAFRDLLTDKAGVPAEVLDMYARLHFPGLKLPTRTQVEDTLAWVTEKGLLKEPLRYEDLVDARFAGESTGK